MIMNGPSNHNSFDNWIAFDLEWIQVNEDFNRIVTFGYDDCHGNKRAIDIFDFAHSDDPDKKFVTAIKDRLLQYDYCLAWGSKSIKLKNEKSSEWEGVDGDLSVLEGNFRYHGIKSIIVFDKLTRIPSVKGAVGGKTVDIDLLKVFAKPIIRTYFKNKYANLKLHNVSNALLGHGKLEDKSGFDVNKMSVKERKRYCMSDAHIVADLVRIQNGDVMKIMQIITEHTGLKLEQVCHKRMTGIWTKILHDSISKKVSLLGSHNISSVLRKLYFNHKQYSANEEVLDMGPKYYGDEDENEEENYDTFNWLGSESIQCEQDTTQSTKQTRKYKGAIVLDPVKGLHHDVYLFDVTSLYPTVIINHNLSPETVNCSCCRNDSKAKYIFTPDILKDCKYAPEGKYWICQRRKGLFAKILQDLTEQRIKYKDAALELENQTIKAIINSGYGVFGHPYFKYYDPRVAELVTAFGRQTLAKMKEIACSLGFNVIYGDTDSLFVNNVKSQRAGRFIDICKSELSINVGHERTFIKLALVGKKHYIGIFVDGSKICALIKGMEGIKSDRPEFIRKAFEQLVEDFKNGVNPIPNMREALKQLDRKEVPSELLAITLPLQKNPCQYENDCVQKRLGLELSLHRGDTLVYYRCNLKKQLYDAKSKMLVTKTIHESCHPKDISYEKYEEMLLRSVKDVIDILGYNFEDILERIKKGENSSETENSYMNMIGLIRQERKETVRKGIDLMFSLLITPVQSLFPRKIMTKRTNGQVLVNSNEEMLQYFEASDFLGCRINAYPSYTEYYEMQYAPNFIFIDLDLSTFGTIGGLQSALSETLENINNVLCGFPTVLWTGNGYHIYLPVDAPVLEQLKQFEEFERPSSKFLRFAAHYLTNGKSDHSHNPSFKSCLIRIPGSFNPKRKEGSNEVKIIQKWNGYRPPIAPLLPSFHADLVSQKMREIKLQRRIEKRNITENAQISTRIKWIEKLLLTPIDDYRKNTIRLILANYLINVKKVSYTDAYAAIRQWLSLCNSVKKLDFDADYLVHCALNNSARTGFKSMRFDTLKDRNTKLYGILSRKKNDHMITTLS